MVDAKMGRHRTYPVGKRTELLDVHRLAEIPQQLLGAAPAGFFLINVAGFAANQFLVLVPHGSAANPLVAIADVYVIEFGHGLKVALAP